ncbi:5817_t:CDS:2, partial [Paraglomus occultum]
KTSLCLALAHLFGFGHVQNDNITGKETRSKFHKAILTEFETKEVVIADRNNHVIKLRETLIDAVRVRYPNVHIIAITWKYPSKDEVFQITVERVRNRGKNHQSLTTDNVGYEKIIKSFLNTFQPINTDKRPDNLVEDVIEVEITSDIKTSLLTVIDKLKPLLDVKKPGDDELENVLEAVTSYKPSIKKAIKKAKPFYYAIPIRDDLEDVIREYFSTHPNADSKLFNDLVKSDRIFKNLHVTLCHREDVKANQSLRTQWNRLNNLVNTEVQITLDKLVFDSEVMALTVKDISPNSIPCVNKYPHITVGTISPEVKPFKALKLLEKAFDMRSEGVTVIDLQDRPLTLEGHVQGVYNV